MSEEEYFLKLAERTGQTIEELKKEFEVVVTEVKADEKLTGFTEEQYKTNARNRFALRKTRESASGAIPWEGIVIGIGDLIDTVSKQRKSTDAAFKANALKTTQGWIYNVPVFDLCASLFQQREQERTRKKNQADFARERTCGNSICNRQTIWNDGNILR